MDFIEQAQEYRNQAYSRLSYAEKWQEALRLRESARSIKRAFLVTEHPDWPAEKVEAELRKIFLYAAT